MAEIIVSLIWSAYAALGIYFVIWIINLFKDKEGSHG